MHRLAAPFAVLVALAAPVHAQSQVVEISASAGYTFSDGVTFPPGVGQLLFDRIEPENAFSWNVGADFLVNQSMQIGALYSRQQSALVLKSPAGSRSFDGLNIDNLHAIFTYNWGYDDDAVRPYLFGGLGATIYNSLQVDDIRVDGKTRFSTTWGAGVKIHPNASAFGLKLGVKWTPTFIRNDPGGIWCDPYWGCYQLANTQFSNQFEFSGGISLRF